MELLGVGHAQCVLCEKVLIVHTTATGIPTMQGVARSKEDVACGDEQIKRPTSSGMTYTYHGGMQHIMGPDMLH